MKYYTTEEVADMFKLNVETIRRQIKAGKIKAIKICNQYRITDEEIERIVKEGE